MKKSITRLTFLLATAFGFNSNAQSPVAITFDEPTFTLTPNSYYQNTVLNDWSSGVTKFRYAWNTSFGGYWESGTAYTNKKDTADGTFSNLYGCAAFGAYNGNNYATSQDGAVITFSNNTTQVSGFFITNTTYAWKTIKNGNGFSRKFGDTTGTNSGGLYPQGGYPDYFKLVVFGYRGGVKNADSAQFYLADYRFTTSSSDYIIKNWQYLNCTAIGVVDSLVFKMRSSDVGSFGMNTPGFFSMDNFTTVNTVGIEELESVSNSVVSPNPTNGDVNVTFDCKNETHLLINVLDLTGKVLTTQLLQSNLGTNSVQVKMETLDSGLYFIKFSDSNTSKLIKVVKL